MKKNIFSELKVFTIILLTVFIWMTVFTNAQMFVELIFNSPEEMEASWTETLENSSNINIAKAQDIFQQTEEILENTEINEDAINPDEEIENQLKKNIKEFTFDFNTLPPENRLIIPKIWLDIPLIDSQFKDEVDFTDWNFDTELSRWAVKYPTTPAPWTNWNSLIFGHTSQEIWKSNYYSTIFVHITELEAWDTFQIVWDGKLYEYEVTNKEIVYPSKVNEVYNQYHNEFEDFITLMWCYPIWSSSKRILVIAKRIV